MAFSILVTPSAHIDLEEQADYIAQDSPVQAARWLAGAWEPIFSLGDNPKRFAVIAESDDLRAELRDTLHHSHRIVYRVDDEGQTVEIIRVWSTARRALTSRDVR